MLKPSRAPGGLSRIACAPVAASDEELVRRTRRGELTAFEELIDRHRDAVYRIAARIVGPFEAEDVAQDAFLRAFNRLDRFRGDASLRTWLLRITHNAALNTLERRARSIPVAEPPEPPPGPSERTPAERLELDERRRRLLAKVGELRADYRSVLVLRDFEDLSYEEIAEVLEAPLGTVKTHLHRARHELVATLRANTYDWGLPE